MLFGNAQQLRFAGTVIQRVASRTHEATVHLAQKSLFPFPCESSLIRVTLLSKRDTTEGLLPSFLDGRGGIHYWSSTVLSMTTCSASFSTSKIRSSMNCVRNGASIPNTDVNGEAVSEGKVPSCIFRVLVKIEVVITNRCTASSQDLNSA